MRAIWSGAIGFGLVNIPVKMYSAIHESTLDLDMLDKKDHSNIKFQRINENTGKVVAWENIVKGYKVKNKYVVITDKDFEAAAAIKTKVIEIKDFMEEAEVNVMYYETPYYLEPEKSGGRSYALLRDALTKTNKVGIGTFVLRNRESLALIKPYEDMLVLHKIRFAEEIRKPELSVPAKTAAKSQELVMAITLINQLSGKFDITEFKDTYTDKLLKIIKAKSRGVKTKMPEMRVVKTNTSDLMKQLKASLNPKKKAS
jgi:DNA end-binding protein Ku